jgi:hypothetical protein
MYHKHCVEKLLKKSVEGISRNNKVFKEYFLSQRSLMIICFINNSMMVFNDIYQYYTLFKIFKQISLKYKLN